MNPELERVCEEKAKHFVKNWAEKDSLSDSEEWALGGAFKDGFKSAIESEQVQQLLRSHKEILECGHCDPVNYCKDCFDLSDEAIKKFEGGTK